jgi:hypothetical protein
LLFRPKRPALDGTDVLNSDVTGFRLVGDDGDVGFAIPSPELKRGRRLGDVNVLHTLVRGIIVPELPICDALEFPPTGLGSDGEEQRSE